MACPWPSCKKLWVIAILGGLTGCIVKPHNLPIDRYDPQAGYRFNALELGEKNTNDLFVFVALSGGGTRAASLAYGVLQGLRDVTLPSGEGGAPARSLLEEVDMISSVSGGSFTAAAYGLWRDDVFDGRFEKRFLRRNVQRDLLFHTLNPLNLVRMPLPIVDSIDIASEYYDRKIFEGKTFADLIQMGTRPQIIINATDMTRQQTFTFRQADFDLLGSDLSTVPLGWATAASSAVPLLLSPMRLHYHPGEQMNAAIKDVLASSDVSRLAARKSWARSLLKENEATTTDQIEFDAENHKFLYLLDGGLADNLGLHSFIEAFRAGVIRERLNTGQIKRLLVIIVDAGTEPSGDFEASLAAPGVLSVGMTSATTGIYNNSALMTAILEYALMEAEPRTKAAYDACRDVIDAQCPDTVAPTRPVESTVEYYVVDINFRNIPQEKKRNRFMKFITSFALPEQDVSALIEEGYSQAREHPQVLRLVKDLGG